MNIVKLAALHILDPPLFDHLVYDFEGHAEDAHSYGSLKRNEQRFVTYEEIKRRRELKKYDAAKLHFMECDRHPCRNWDTCLMVHKWGSQPGLT